MLAGPLVLLGPLAFCAGGQAVALALDEVLMQAVGLAHDARLFVPPAAALAAVAVAAGIWRGAYRRYE